MTTILIKATATRQNGHEKLHFFGKTISINSSQISHVSSEGPFLTEIVMSNGISFIVGGRAKDYQKLIARA